MQQILAPVLFTVYEDPPLPPAPVQYAAGPFAKVGGVRAHMVVHSIQVERNSYNCLGLSFPPPSCGTCSECMKSFTPTGTLRVHMRTHSREVGLKFAVVLNV